MDVCESGNKKAVEVHRCLETNVQGQAGGGYAQMAQLLGGSASDPLGNWRLKKFKLDSDKLNKGGTRSFLL
ncbi:unnamed protein product [Urochloa humidicola]